MCCVRMEFFFVFVFWSLIIQNIELFKIHTYIIQNTEQTTN